MNTNTSVDSSGRCQLDQGCHNPKPWNSPTATSTNTPATPGSRADLIRLKSAIATMALRYGDSRVDYVLAVVQSANDDTKSRLRRASSRRYAALIRLTRALADLSAQGGAR